MTRDEFYEALLSEYQKWFLSSNLVCTLHSRPAGVTVLATSVKALMPLIDRYVAERDTAIRAPVQAVVKRHHDFPSEATSATFDGPYEYAVRVRLTSDELEAAEQWLTAQEKP